MGVGRAKNLVNFRFLELFLAKKLIFFFNFGLFSLSLAMFENVIVTSSLTNFHEFGINGKRKPYPIPWYQTIILWARQFQVHKGVVTTPLGKPCYKKGLVGRGLRLRILNVALQKYCPSSYSEVTVIPCRINTLCEMT